MGAIAQRGISIILVVTLTFLALRVIPGDAIEAQMIQSGAPISVIEARRAELGLNRPVVEQFADYVIHLTKGVWGVSLYSGLSVQELIGQNLVETITVALPSLFFASVIGVFAGMLLALYSTSYWIRLLRFIVTLAVAAPIYWTATLAILSFSIVLDLVPASGTGSIAHVLLPIGILTFHSGGAIAQIAISSLEQVRDATFIQTAYAKGLPESRIISMHILRVGLIPIISVIALQAGFLISGTVIIESVFVRPGVGRLLLEATLSRDYPVVQGIVLITALFYVGFNALADILYPILDPRVRNVN